MAFNNRIVIQWGQTGTLNVPAYKDTLNHVTLPYTYTWFYRPIVTQHAGSNYWADVTTQATNVLLGSFDVHYYNALANVTALSIKSFWISIGV